MTDHATSARSAGTNETSGGLAPAVDWVEFERRLSASLRGLGRDRYLILTLPATEDATPTYYVQFARFERTGMRAEAVSSAYLHPAPPLTPEQEVGLLALGWDAPDDDPDRPGNFSVTWDRRPPYAAIASLAVRTLRDVYGIAEPGALVYRRFHRTDGAEDDPSLGLTHERAPHRHDGDPRLPMRERMHDAIERTLREAFGVAEPARDAQGDYLLLLERCSVVIRPVPDDPPIVRVLLTVRDGVPGSPHMLEFVNEMNLRTRVAKVVHAGDRLVVAADVTGHALAETALVVACLAVESAGNAIVEALREGGAHGPATEGDGGDADDPDGIGATGGEVRGSTAPDPVDLQLGPALPGGRVPMPGAGRRATRLVN